MVKQIWILGLAIIFLSGSAYAKEAKKIEKKAAPQLAGFGMVAVKHTCSLSFEGCLTSCKNVAGTNCAEECAADCNVCSLDFGEDSADLCR